MMNSEKYSAGLMSAANQGSNSALNLAMNTGMAWLDMVLNVQREMQRLSLASISSYSPTTSTRVSSRLPTEEATSRVVPVGEERLNVATRTTQGEVTRIHRRVVTQPVEQDVTLREEKVVVERRSPVNPAPSQDILRETVVEMSDSTQVPTVWKSVHVAEEVVLRKHVTERTEKVRETVRRDVIDVEHARETLPAHAHAVEGHVEHEHLPALRPERAEKGRSDKAHASGHAAEHASAKHAPEETKKPVAALAAPQPAGSVRKSAS